MPGQVRSVHDMEIDEISLVDRPANQHARVAIAKRATQETTVADEYFNEDGSAADLDALDIGDIVYDYEGNPFQAEADEDELADERELESVGKSAGVADSAFGTAAATRVSKSLADEVREALSKAVTADERDEVITKALGQISKAEERAAGAEAIAKAERTLRLEREYISKAAEYNVPIEADELGPVLMRMAEGMSYADCAVIHKALSAAGEMLFTEAGFSGQADNADPFSQVEAYLEAQVAKSADGSLSKAQATTDFFTDNPAAYDDYVAGLGR